MWNGIKPEHAELAFFVAGDYVKAPTSAANMVNHRAVFRQVQRVPAIENMNCRYQQYILGSVIGGLVALAYLSWLGLEILGGTFSAKLHLPFHLCRTANLLVFIVLIFRSYLAYEIVFFWGLTVIHAVITPDILQGFPHFHFSLS